MNKKNLKLEQSDKVLISYLKTPVKYSAYVEFKEEEVINERTGQPEIIRVPNAVLQKIGGERLGIIVAIGPNTFGWSLCKTKQDNWYNNEADVFNREKGLSIALSRAKYVSKLNDEQKIAYYAEKLPNSLLDLFGDMQIRALKYFNYKK